MSRSLGGDHDGVDSTISDRLNKLIVQFSSTKNFIALIFGQINSRARQNHIPWTENVCDQGKRPVGWRRMRWIRNERENCSSRASCWLKHLRRWLLCCRRDDASCFRGREDPQIKTYTPIQRSSRSKNQKITPKLGALSAGLITLPIISTGKEISQLFSLWFVTKQDEFSFTLVLI